MRVGEDVRVPVHAPGLGADDAAGREVVAGQLGAARGHDPGQARGRGREHAQRLLDHVVHVRQVLDVVVGEAVGQGLQLREEPGLDVGVAADQPDEVGQRVGLLIYQISGLSWCSCKSHARNI